eukprot:scaffold375_cov378-Prasinococcus_capsulatus_cf.AAC.10
MGRGGAAEGGERRGAPRGGPARSARVARNSPRRAPRAARCATVRLPAVAPYPDGGAAAPRAACGSPQSPPTLGWWARPRGRPTLSRAALRPAKQLAEPGRSATTGLWGACGRNGGATRRLAAVYFPGAAASVVLWAAVGGALRFRCTCWPPRCGERLLLEREEEPICSFTKP